MKKNLYGILILFFGSMQLFGAQKCINDEPMSLVVPVHLEEIKTSLRRFAACEAFKRKDLYQHDCFMNLYIELLDVLIVNLKKYSLEEESRIAWQSIIRKHESNMNLWGYTREEVLMVIHNILNLRWESVEEPTRVFVSPVVVKKFDRLNVVIKKTRISQELLTDVMVLVLASLIVDVNTADKRKVQRLERLDQDLGSMVYRHASASEDFKNKAEVGQLMQHLYALYLIEHEPVFREECLVRLGPLAWCSIAVITIVVTMYLCGEYVNPF
ncbi:hypothetical protein FJ364_03370 [Candidatus Dependentiae bacterium]|nr:hypothetical protein [Candidatus Dependentiae bacterium]